MKISINKNYPRMSRPDGYYSMSLEGREFVDDILSGRLKLEADPRKLKKRKKKIESENFELMKKFESLKSRLKLAK